MTPRAYLKAFEPDARLLAGSYYPTLPLEVTEQDRVGVVLMNLGGPSAPDDVERYLYRIYMDPAIVTWRWGNWARPRVAQRLAQKQAKTARPGYERIGGKTPFYRMVRDQAQALQTELLKRGIAERARSVQIYLAVRHGLPSPEDTMARMQADGITKVVLLPLYPQYAKSTTGSCLAYWWHAQQAKGITWPTAVVPEFSVHPKYVQSVSERIDEALQRLTRAQRDSVRLVFSALTTTRADLKRHSDQYCCLVHSTVDRVMEYRGNDLPYQVGFQGRLGPFSVLEPRTEDLVAEAAQDGHGAVCVVPISCVSDSHETAYSLDVALREKAKRHGLRALEVVTALNCHVLFIEALADMITDHVRTPESAEVPQPARAKQREATPPRSCDPEHRMCDACPVHATPREW